MLDACLDGREDEFEDDFNASIDGDAGGEVELEDDVMEGDAGDVTGGKDEGDAGGEVAGSGDQERAAPLSTAECACQIGLDTSCDEPGPGRAGRPCTIEAEANEHSRSAHDSSVAKPLKRPREM